MDIITKAYKESVGSLVVPLGFKSYRKNYYRVINDIFQSVNLHKSVSGDNCTIEFVIAPLCAGDFIKKDFCGTNHLKMFKNDYSWFPYNKDDEGSVNNCVGEMISYVETYLIPYFERSSDSTKAYYEVCAFQEHHKHGMQPFDYLLFCMSLKAGLYDKSLEHLYAQKKQTEYVYNSNKQFREQQGQQLSTEYSERIANKIKLIEYQTEMISRFDIEYIHSFIRENERRALANLGILRE